MNLLSKSTIPIGRTSLADSVYETLLEAIVTGSLACGIDINEVNISKELGVSRTPVHEAVVRLEADGLIELTIKRKFQVVQFTRQQIIEIYEMRILLEATAAERAATRIDPQAINDLIETASELEKTKDQLNWVAVALDFDIHFHDVLAKASDNQRLQKDIGRYRLLVRGLCRITGSTEILSQAFDEHMKILDALVENDPKRASKAMEKHIEARLKAVLLEVDRE